MKNKVLTFTLAALCLCAIAVSVTAQVGVVPRFGVISNGVTGYPLGSVFGTAQLAGQTTPTNQGFGINANSAIQFGSLTYGSLTNSNAFKLYRGRGLNIYATLFGSNNAAGTNLVVLTGVICGSTNINNPYDWVGPGPGGIGPYSATFQIVGSNVTTYAWPLGPSGTPYSPGNWLAGVSTWVPGSGTNAGTFVPPYYSIGGLDNAEWFMLLSISNIGSLPVWIHTNGVKWAAFP